MPLTEQQERYVLNMIEKARRDTNAFIVIGVLPGDRFFYSVDDTVSVEDLQGILQRNLFEVCASVRRKRMAKKNGGSK